MQLSGGESGGSSSSSASGVVTVVFDTENTTFITNSTRSNQVFPVKITNGTSNYQQVKFGLIMQCVTTTSNVAEVTDITSVLVNTGTPFAISYVPDVAKCQIVYFTWSIEDVILIPPNKDYTAYVYINGITTANAEVWQITVTSVIATKL